MIYLTYVLLFTIIYLMGSIYKSNPQVTIINKIPSSSPPRNEETRGPPYRDYAPQRFQQIGILIAEGQPTLPLYGRETPYHRSRYNYYTVTSGNQLYPLIITIDGRDCTEDLGCKELYGSEDVTVIDRPDVVYKAQMYRIP